MFDPVRQNNRHLPTTPSGLVNRVPQSKLGLFSLLKKAAIFSLLCFTPSSTAADSEPDFIQTQSRLYLKFDGDYLDSSSDPLVITAAGPGILADGFIGGAANFTHGNLFQIFTERADRLEIGNNPFSLSAFFKLSPQEPQEPRSTIISKGFSKDFVGYRLSVLNVNQSQQLIFETGTKSNIVARLSTDASITPGNWHWVVATHGNGTAVLYLNGTQVNQTMILNNNYDLTIGYEMVIGRNSISQINEFAYFNGLLDEVMLLIHALSSAQVDEMGAYYNISNVSQSNLMLTLPPTHTPSIIPSVLPSETPSNYPSIQPTDIPSIVPSTGPSDTPSIIPSVMPSQTPSQHPSVQPTDTPSIMPSEPPSQHPSAQPTDMPKNPRVPTHTPSRNTGSPTLFTVIPTDTRTTSGIELMTTTRDENITTSSNITAIGIGNNPKHRNSQSSFFLGFVLGIGSTFCCTAMSLMIYCTLRRCVRNPFDEIAKISYRSADNHQVVNDFGSSIGSAEKDGDPTTGDLNINVDDDEVIENNLNLVDEKDDEKDYMVDTPISDGEAGGIDFNAAAYLSKLQMENQTSDRPNPNNAQIQLEPIHESLFEQKLQDSRDNENNIKNDMIDEIVKQDQSHKKEKKVRFSIFGKKIKKDDDHDNNKNIAQLSANRNISSLMKSTHL